MARQVNASAPTGRRVLANSQNFQNSVSAAFVKPDEQKRFESSVRCCAAPDEKPRGSSPEITRRRLKHRFAVSERTQLVSRCPHCGRECAKSDVGYARCRERTGENLGQCERLARITEALAAGVPSAFVRHLLRAEGLTREQARSLVGEAKQRLQIDQWGRRSQLATRIAILLAGFLLLALTIWQWIAHRK